MVLLGEERAVQHRRLQHRDLQPREQRLDAVGQVLGLEDEIEQHRDQLDRHRLELVRLLAERRFLQVAQHVVRALRNARELDERAAAQVETALARLQSREALAQRRRRHDRRARDVARRRRRERTARDVAPAAAATHVDLRKIAAAALRRVEHSGRRLPHRRSCPAGPLGRRHCRNRLAAFRRAARRCERGRRALGTACPANMRRKSDITSTSAVGGSVGDRRRQPGGLRGGGLRAVGAGLPRLMIEARPPAGIDAQTGRDAC